MKSLIPAPEQLLDFFRPRFPYPLMPTLGSKAIEISIRREVKKMSVDDFVHQGEVYPALVLAYSEADWEIMTWFVSEMHDCGFRPEVAIQWDRGATHIAVEMKHPRASTGLLAALDPDGILHDSILLGRAFPAVAVTYKLSSRFGRRAIDFFLELFRKKGKLFLLMVKPCGGGYWMAIESLTLNLPYPTHKGWD